MTDHEHEWRTSLDEWGEFYCADYYMDCPEILSKEQAETMLNEHAKLKRVRDAARTYRDYALQYAPWDKCASKLDDALADTKEKE